MNANLQIVQAIVNFWKPKLGLEKWTIRVHIVGGGTLEGADGDCDWDQDSRSAKIQIREDQKSLEDLHETVIHEMFHCVFWWVGKSKLKTALLEHAFLDFIPALAAWSVKVVDH